MLLTFTKPEFESLIKEGIKKHTIRRDTHNRWKVGNLIHFWLGNPRNVHAKNKPHRFGIGECTRVENVKMLFDEKDDLNIYDIVWVGSAQLSTWEELEALAKNDGFDSWNEMKKWFDNPSREFKGKVIFWNYKKCAFGNTMLEASVCEPSEIIKKAAEILQPIKYDPHHKGYFVLMNDIDMGDEDYCENCIADAVKSARKYHKEKRQEILNKFKEIAETGFFNGVNIKEKYSEKDISKAKRYELKEYPAKASFTYEGHDPDFGGGKKYAKNCQGCGDYFHTNFEPDIEEAIYLLEEFGDGTNLSETLKWKLDIAFYNYDDLEEDTQKVLLSIAEKIVAVS